MSDTEWEMVLPRENQPSSSIFPPTDHEDLQVHADPSKNPNSPSSPSSSSVSSLDAVEGHGEELQADPEAPAGGDGVGRSLRRRLEVVRAGFLHLGSRVRDSAVSSGVGFWSVVSAGGVMVAAVLVSLLYRRVRQWRLQLVDERNRRLALLIRDRDEKINRLLLQVARADKLLSARQSAPIQRLRVPVPVIRVRTGQPA